MEPIGDSLLELIPFSPEEAPAVRLTGNLHRSGSRLAIHFSLVGAVEMVVLPEPRAAGARHDGLWQATCFEWFLAPGESAGYWEFNLTPSGDWNAYRFDAYRQGMREETAVTAIPFESVRRPGHFSLSANLDLAGWLDADQPLQAAMSAVIESIDGWRSYWALGHPGPLPDFHHRDGFLLRL